MNQKIKNSEHPYFPTSPVQDQFGQIIVAFGVTKREKFAMELLINKMPLLTSKITNEMIKDCYDKADKFLNYEAEKETNIIM